MYSNEDLGLDQPQVAALLIMMLAAEISNVGIHFQIPKKWFHMRSISMESSLVLWDQL